MSDATAQQEERKQGFTGQRMQTPDPDIEVDTQKNKKMDSLKAEDSGLSDLIPSHDFKYLLGAGSHIYISRQTSLPTSSQVYSFSSLLDISTWKANKHLKLNIATTEFLIWAPLFQLKPVSLAAYFQDKKIYCLKQKKINNCHATKTSNYNCSYG